MEGYGWEEYDARHGGRQVMHDPDNHLDITTEYVKFPGGAHGGSWGARITGKPRKDIPADLPSTVVFYVGLEGHGDIGVSSDFEELGYSGDLGFTGFTEDLGDFTMTITAGPKANRHPRSDHPTAPERPLDRTFVNSITIPEAAIWQTKPLLFRQMKKQLDLMAEEYGAENMPPPWQAFTIGQEPQGSGNLYLVQKVFADEFQFDVIFSSGSADKPVTSSDITAGIQANTERFVKTFSETFKPSRPFDISKYTDFAHSLFSNLVGGIGFFHGDQIIDRTYDEAYEEDDEGFWEDATEARKNNQPEMEGPYNLFTSVPSRSFFPRGFLWDEGFHLLPILDWDPALALEIVKSWFNTMDKDGWIPREQILGLEARSKVPPEFATQYPHYANPPTLFVVLEDLASRLDDKSKISAEEKAGFTATLKEIYPLLKRNYEWYRKTQRGDFKSYERKAANQKEGYRWRGRTPAHILTSGLDDYPRAQPPSPGELHVDLLSWMGMMTRALKNVAAALGDGEEVKELGAIESAILQNVDDLHWSEEHATYCDSTIDAFEDAALVCHKGYVSIFPFMTGLVGADNAHLGAVLDLIGDPEELWSEHGIRSLSKRDEHYGKDENYWRSPVWVNMNYLILENLLKTARADGPQQGKAKDLYERLRRNVVETVWQSWKDTGFAWEQYNPETGKGQRTQHFTGWTSLVVKIMSMPDLSPSGRPHEEL